MFVDWQFTYREVWLCKQIWQQKSALSQILSEDHHNLCLSQIFWLNSSWNGYKCIVEAGHHELYLHIKAFSRASYAGICKPVHMLWDHSLTTSCGKCFVFCVIYLRGVLRVFPCTMSSPAFCYLSHHSQRWAVFQLNVFEICI